MDDHDPQSVDSSPPHELSDEQVDAILMALFGEAHFRDAQQSGNVLPQLRAMFRIACSDPCTRPPSGQGTPEPLLVRGHIWAQLGMHDLARTDFAEFQATDLFRKEVASVLSPDTPADMRREYLAHITRMLERMPLEAFRRFDYAREMWVIANRHSLRDSSENVLRIRPDAESIIFQFSNAVALLDEILDNPALQAFDNEQT